MKLNLKEDGKRLLVVVIAAMIMALNIKSFVRTGELFPGGASGLTLLIQRAAEMFFQISLPYTLVNVLLNAIPVYIGFRFIGKKFTLLSCVMIVLTSIFTDLIPGIIITQDTLLISIFGGMINGFVISLCLAMNATTGGTDFLAIYFSQKRGGDSFNLVLYVNAVILAIGGLLFGWDKALYSIIFQFASTQVLHGLYKKYQQQTLLIVTNKPENICEIIDRISHHGATILQGDGAYEHKERHVVYSVVSGAESKKIIREIRKVEPKAFINLMPTEEIAGKFHIQPNE